MGEPSSCNAENNSLDLFRIMDGHHAIRVTEADHCDFEYPTNFGCQFNCENSNASVSDEIIRAEIVTLGTSAILSLTGISSDGLLYWIGN